jgi:serine/threonine protein kinase
MHIYITIIYSYIQVQNNNSDKKVCIKIVDFGYCLIETKISSKPCNFLYGTAGFMSPEVLSERVYTPACDIYSIGVVMYILLSGTMPFSKSNQGIYTYL